LTSGAFSLISGDPGSTSNSPLSRREDGFSLASDSRRTMENPMAGRSSAHERFREVLLLVAPAVLAVAFAFWFTYQFVEPAPPPRVAIATGSESGAYHAFAMHYKEILDRSGIELIVKSTAGSMENLRLLGEKGSGVNLALLQGGLTDHQKRPDLVSLGRMFPEPVWVFYKGDLVLDRLVQLSGRRIAIGAEASGTQVLARQLLSANGITDANATLLAYGGEVAAKALRNGEVDATFLVLSPKAKLVSELLRDPDVKLMSFAQAEAYTRIFPFLAKAVLPAGVIDLQRAIPATDVTLVAAQAALVANEDVHPAIVGLMAEAAKEVHGGGGIFQQTEEFPKARDPEFPMQSDAERIYKRGPPFLQRYLPFWLANFIERSLIMIVPIATILLPLVRIVPWLYEWRIRTRILFWYGELKKLENEVADVSVTEKDKYEHELTRIDTAVSQIPVPLHYADKLYELRAAVDLVRLRIAALN
jgi:TRAP transporter TAXI family solute receptor